jgi:hypothetical protein
MLRNSLVTCAATSNYLNRTPHFPINYARSRYNTLWGKPVSRSALSHKGPDEWHRTWDQRSGFDWHHRQRRRHMFVGWPWISWRDDPIRKHKRPNASRTFSAQLADTGGVGYPLWDHYAETAADYRLPNNADTRAALKHVLVYVGATWKHEDVVRYLDIVAAAFPTVEQIAQAPAGVRAWRTEKHAAVPLGFLEHLILFCRDVMRNNSKKAYRAELQRRGVLRTNDMTRYYALPRVSAGQPAMPEKLAQAEGAEPVGDYQWLLSGGRFHNIFAPRNPSRAGFYDA